MSNTASSSKSREDDPEKAKPETRYTQVLTSNLSELVEIGDMVLKDRVDIRGDIKDYLIGMKQVCERNQVEANRRSVSRSPSPSKMKNEMEEIINHDSGVGANSYQL